ncbi:MAG: ATP-binding protein [Lentisphaeria bacterium]|nr:ATP-binding protein [Lentisphaeria bacterium]
MKRFAIQQLLNWKQDPARKPLLLLGARQVGKTWLMQEFGRLHFKKCAYINLDKKRRIAEAFEQDFDLDRILMALQIQTGMKITPQDTLIILDEIQSCPAAMTALKYFCEDAREYPVIAAGSLLGVSDLTGTGFPVGKIDRIYLYPMTFPEFLDATGNESQLELIRSRDWEMIKTFQSDISLWLRYYYFIGGMPEAVASFAANKDFGKVRKIQRSLLADYRNDFGKHAPKEIKPRIEMIWDSVPAQLARENKKFIYAQVHEGESRATLEPALEWLKDSGLVTIACRVTKPALPLISYKGEAFKLYFLDVGLLAAASDLNVRTIIEGNRIFQEFKGALTEQYVQQQLQAEFGMPPYYWVSKSGQAEVDFLAEYESVIFPIEAKAEKNLQSKSLKVFCRKYQPQVAVRTSMSHYFKQEISFDGKADTAPGGSYTLIDLPLYAISQMLPELHSLSLDQ